MDDADRGRYLVPALERGLAIIGMFARGRTAVTVPQIVQTLRVPRATAFRLAYTLEACGFIERMPNSHAFHLGPRALAAALEYLYSFDAADIARPLLERVRDDTGSTAQLAVRDGTSVLYIVRAVALDATGAPRRRLPQARHEAHIVASGRALLFDLTPEQLTALYQDFAFSAFAAPAAQDLPGLMAQLSEERAQGYAVARALFGTDVTSVAVPVRNGESATIAAVTVFGPDLRDPAIERLALQRATEAASLISLGLGFRSTT